MTHKDWEEEVEEESWIFGDWWEEENGEWGADEYGGISIYGEVCIGI